MSKRSRAVSLIIGFHMTLAFKIPGFDENSISWLCS
jgi:hypothetical protein